MAGIIEHRTSALAAFAEAVEVGLQVGEIAVAGELGVKAQFLKQRLDGGGGIVGRVGQLRQTGVTAIADDQRDAFSGGGGTCGGCLRREQHDSAQSAKAPRAMTFSTCRNSIVAFPSPRPACRMVKAA